MSKRTTSSSSSSSGTSTREQSPVKEGYKKGVPHASLNSDNERSSTDILAGWLLTEDQALGDISLMRVCGGGNVFIPRGVYKFIGVLCFFLGVV